MLLSRLAYALRSRLCPPNVIVDILWEDGLLFVVLKNIGAGPAEHISVTFTPDIQGLRGTVSLSSLALFQNLPFLPPDKTIRAFLDVGRAYFKREAPTRFATTVRFRSENGTLFRRSSTHELAVYRELGFLERSHARCPQTTQPCLSSASPNDKRNLS